MNKKKGGAQTVRGQGSKKVEISRPTTDQVFGYATIPRSFRGSLNNQQQQQPHFVQQNSNSNNGLPYSPTGPLLNSNRSSLNANNNARQQQFFQYSNVNVSPSRVQQHALPYTPTGPHSSSSGQQQMMMSHGSNSFSSNLSTFRHEPYNSNTGHQYQSVVVSPPPKPMMVVDGGLVLNRFRRPSSSGGGSVGGGSESLYGYGRVGEGLNNYNPVTMNVEFNDRNRGYHHHHQEEKRPASQEEEDTSAYYSPTGDSFDMSYNNSTPPALPEHPPSSRRPPPENKPSLLLNKEENQTIFEILGRGKQTLATAVIRLLVPTLSQQGWQTKETGVACLVRNTTKKSYFIEVFSLRSKAMVFRQEIYNQFEYQAHSHHQNFITFEGNHSSVGIQFADFTEATQFREALDSKLEAKRQRRNEREQHRRSRILNESNHNQNAGHHPQYPQQQQQQQPPPPPPPITQYNRQPSISQNNSSPLSNGISSGSQSSVVSSTTTTTYTFPTSFSSSKSNKSKSKEKDKKKVVLRKEDIGNPMHFRHVQHVGWDPNKGFDLNGVDNNLRTFFEMAGVSANELQDENTRKFIYNFIEQNGGIETIKKLPERPAAPLPPSSHHPHHHPQSSSSMGQAPPVPNRQGSKPAAPPPPPSRPIPPVPSGGGPPPPPPPTRTMNIGERQPMLNYQSSPSPAGYNQQQNSNNGPARPPPPTFSSSSSQSSPRVGGSHSNGPVAAAPPPPPPPPMPGIGAPPPPPPPPMSSQGHTDFAESGRSNAQPTQQPVRSAMPPVPDDRSNLLAAIQKGVQLKKVDPVENAGPKRPVGGGGGGLADCLGQIQKGIELKPVPVNTKEATTIDTMDGLAGALARALADRSKAIRPDSSSSEDDEEDVVDDDEWD